MARRKVKAVKLGRCTVTIYKDSYANEFVVVEKIGKRVTGGKANGGYFASDRQDARNTAAAMVRRLRSSKSC